MLTLSKSHDTYVDIESRTINQKRALKRIQTRGETNCTTNSSEYLQQQDEARDAD